MRNSKEVLRKISSGSLRSGLLFLFLLLFSGGCSLSAKKQGSTSEEGLDKGQQRELLEPLGISARIYLGNQ